MHNTTVQGIYEFIKFECVPVSVFETDDNPVWVRAVPYRNTLLKEFRIERNVHLVSVRQFAVNDSPYIVRGSDGNC